MSDTNNDGRVLTRRELRDLATRLAAVGLEDCDSGWTGRGTAIDYAEFQLDHEVGELVQEHEEELTEACYGRLWDATRDALISGYDPELHDPKVDA